MRRYSQIAAPLLASVALSSLTGCRQPEMQRCVDETNQVVDDKLCGPQQQQQQQPARSGYHGGYHYYYGGYGGRGLGSFVSGGATAPVSGHSYSTGTSRGGFGSTFSSSHGGEGGGHGSSSGGHGGGGE